jgi:Endonuclease/Exonuclease/phosphatase family
VLRRHGGRVCLASVVASVEGIPVRLVSVNIRNNPDMSRAQVRADVAAVRRWSAPADVVFWQEIGDVSDHRAIRRVFNLARGFRHLFGQRQTPISLRVTRWRILDSYYVKTHPGLAGITPARGFAVVLVASRRDPSVRVALIGTHFISGAWYGNHSRQDWRRDRWREHWHALDDEVADLHAQGLTVVVGGDWNRKRPDIPLFASRQRWAVSHWYDGIVVCPAPGGTVTVTEGRICPLDLHTDHRPVLTDIDLSGPVT